MSRNDKKYYYSDRKLELREIRGVKGKLTAGVFAATALCLTAILLVNHVASDFLGLGYGRAANLAEENRELRNQVTMLSERMQNLDASLERLSDDGDRLRLMVDLPKMDDAVRLGGTGGAVRQSDVTFTSDNTAAMLESSLSTLQKLTGEIEIQQQSFAEIERKYLHNQDYFSALPALKPMDGFYSVGGFGKRMHPVLGVFKTHHGLDIINDVGTSVYASGDGVVEMAGQSGNGYGTVVAVKHGFGFQTLYAHLSKVAVREGQRVKRGELLGKSGRSGLVSGPHLHYEVRQNGIFRNPTDFFFNDLSPGQYHALAESQ